MKNKRDDWQKVAKKVWPTLTSVQPESFTKTQGEVHITADGFPIVIVIKGRDKDKLKSIL